MNVLWPYFHDPEFKPDRRERYAMHWKANLLMLKSFRAVSVFLIISLTPITLFVILFEFIGPLGIDQTGGGPNLTTLVTTQLGLMIAYLCVQHMAFVIAMNITYVPYVRQAIRDRGTPICLECGHLLASDSSRCTECGRQP